MTDSTFPVPHFLLALFAPSHMNMSLELTRLINIPFVVTISDCAIRKRIFAKCHSPLGLKKDCNFCKERFCAIFLLLSGVSVFTQSFDILFAVFSPTS